MSKAWITRTQPGADRCAEGWREAGFDPVVAPVLQVVAKPNKAEVREGASLVFTSTHGVRFCSVRPSGQTVYAVGETTAKAARDAGFYDVRVGGGDVRRLAQAIEKAAGEVVHVCGERMAGDLVAMLAARGIRACKHVVYSTQKIDRPLGDRPVPRYVTAYSPFGAERLQSLLPKTWQGTVFAMSEAVAEPLGGRRVVVAGAPTNAALIEAARFATARREE